MRARLAARALASIVSKSEPCVVTVTLLGSDTSTLYQTVLPIEAPEQSSGSPLSSVAANVPRVSSKGSGDAAIASAKLSFAGAAPDSNLMLS